MEPTQIQPDLVVIDDPMMEEVAKEPRPGDLVAAPEDKRMTGQPPPGWPVFMVWPPPRDLVDDAFKSRMNDEKQMRLFGRPAFVIDGIALTIMVDITGHRPLVRGNNRITIK